MSYQAAAEAGVDILDTAMSPFALGTSQPPTESVVAAFAHTPRDTGIDLMVLREVKNHCQKLRSRYEGLFTPVAERVDSDVLIYQLPGGMITNLVSQLKEQDAMDKHEDVLAEVPRVREDLGFPPLVTPTSQIVGTQAVMNVLMGDERYKNVTKEVKDYVRGLYGKAPGIISDDIRRKIIGDEEVITCRPADLLEPMYTKMRSEAIEHGLISKEEDVLTYILYPAVAPSFLKGERVPEDIPHASALPVPALGTIPGRLEVEVDGEIFSVRIVSVEGQATAQDVTGSGKPPRGDIPGGIKSNMQGIILKLPVGRGDTVQTGDTLVVLEAMKMENPITSPRSGTVTEVFVDVGDMVQSGDVLLVIEE